ncbi:AAA family ATPase [Fulvivirgaceae bacterium PWU4]|uniref:AAA family ATPase n=1 Tax=Chryseosolibacter histidini TaxID=2782349 RepID=A0AAP2DGQ8_9BACT|nr:AAA family ATPase [Chryseosolibacter histidini]MBT1696063.1 AAA family ATPase [Chryseosolibacter histidini]
MIIPFLFKNSNRNEVNDVPHPKIFQIEGYAYTILIRPKCEFWRIGLRFSNDIRGSGWSTTHRYNNSEIKHIEVCVGVRPDGSWQNPNSIQLQQYNIQGVDDTLYTCNEYLEQAEVQLKIESKPFGKIQVQIFSGNCFSATEVDLGWSKTFQIFGWSDFTDFEIDMDVTPGLVPLTLDLKDIKALSNRRTSITIEKLAVFFGGNNCGKTSVLVAACNAYHDKHYSSMDYLGLNRIHSASEFDFEIDALSENDKQSKQAENRRRRIENSLGQNEIFDWMEELALQDEETRSKVFTWINTHFERWEFEEQKTGKYVTGVRARVNQRHPLDQGTGVRAVLPIITQLFNPQVELLAVDEPEFGLEPRMQKMVFRAIKNATEGVNGFPLKRVILATHSHLFLDRADVTNNFSITKNEGVVHVTQLANIEELQNSTYKLLGSNPNDLFFPSNVVIVEGRSDQIFLNGIYQLGKHSNLFESEGLVFHYLEGFDKLAIGSEAIAQMLKTQSYIPVYKDKFCGLFDRPHRNGKLIEDVREYFNDSDKRRFVLLEMPAIEFYYPVAIINKIFSVKLTKSEYESIVQGYLDTIRGSRSPLAEFLGTPISKVDLAEAVVKKMAPEDLQSIDPNILSLLKTADELAYK